MTVHLDGRKMTSREQAHLYLQETLQLPQYYGKNLDALFDCIAERGRMEIVLLHDAQMRAALGEYGERLIEVFRDAENVELILADAKDPT